MPRNGSGVYSLPNSPFVVATIIDQTVMNADLSDLGTALTQSISVDGQTTPTGNLPMGNFKHTGAGAATTTGQYVTYGQAGPITFSVPTAGVGLTITGVSGSNIADFVTTANTAIGIVRVKNAGAGAGTKARLQLDDGTADLGFLEGDCNGTTVSLKAVNRNNTLDFWTGSSGGAQRVTISSAGLLTALFGVSTTTVTASGALSVSGASALVAATASGLVTANAGVKFLNGGSTVNWYEEGTFTPVITGIGTPTYTTQTGEFNRTGNKVKFRLTMAWTGGNNAAAVATVTGLPYSSTAAIHPVQIVVNILNAALTYSGVPISYMNGSSAVVIGTQASSTSIGSVVNPNAGSKDMYIAGEYFV